jgi:hypothetical protein
MIRSSFLRKVLKQNQKFVSNDFQKYRKPISRIQDDIIAEAKKGKYSLEINKKLDEPICQYFTKEGFIVVTNDLSDCEFIEMECTEIKWKF